MLKSVFIPYISRKIHVIILPTEAWILFGCVLIRYGNDGVDFRLSNQNKIL